MFVENTISRYLYAESTKCVIRVLFNPQLIFGDLQTTLLLMKVNKSTRGHVLIACTVQSVIYTVNSKNNLRNGISLPIKKNYRTRYIDSSTKFNTCFFTDWVLWLWPDPFCTLEWFKVMKIEYLTKEELFLILRHNYQNNLILSAFFLFLRTIN